MDKKLSILIAVAERQDNNEDKALLLIANNRDKTLKHGKTIAHCEFWSNPKDRKKYSKKNA